MLPRESMNFFKNVQKNPKQFLDYDSIAIIYESKGDIVLTREDLPCHGDLCRHYNEGNTVYLPINCSVEGRDQRDHLREYFFSQLSPWRKEIDTIIAELGVTRKEYCELAKHVLVLPPNYMWNTPKSVIMSVVINWRTFCSYGYFGNRPIKDVVRAVFNQNDQSYEGKFRQSGLGAGMNTDVWSEQYKRFFGGEFTIDHPTKWGRDSMDLNQPIRKSKVWTDSTTYVRRLFSKPHGRYVENDPDYAQSDEYIYQGKGPVKCVV